MTTSNAAGWYDDPDDSTAERYWDGQNWTPQRQRKQNSARPAAAPYPAPASFQQPQQLSPANYQQPQGTPAQPLPPPPYVPAQPSAVALGAQQQSMPNAHVVWAVFSIFYCFPFGIIAIINATKVSNLWALGQYDAARAAASSARKFAMWGMIAFAVCWVGGFLFWVLIFGVIGSLGSTTS
jgi:hypothetical protein